MSKRENISTGTTWENSVGYSRAVKVGTQIFVSGTIAVDDNGIVVGKNDPYRQTIFILKKIKSAIEKSGGNLSDVVRTRMYVVNINDWSAIGKAHGEFFKDIKPASTMVEVSKLIQPEFLIEIEADAIIDTK
jgi:enamine deaminase RidA (YjgF/YER057c/UK114 family)